VHPLFRAPCRCGWASPDRVAADPGVAVDSPVGGYGARMTNQPCCDMHNRHCEPPGDLCCRRCTEASHDSFPVRHADSTACVLTCDADCLDCAVRKVKADLGVTTTTADLIARHLPEHLRQPFWRRAIADYLGIELARAETPEPTG